MPNIVLAGDISTSISPIINPNNFIFITNSETTAITSSTFPTYTLPFNTYNYVRTASGIITSTNPLIWTNTNATFTGTGTVIYNTLVNNSNAFNSKHAKLGRPNHKPVRSAIKKALKLITGLGFGDEIKVFLGGSEIEVSHPDSEFKFVITKYDNSIISRTKSPGLSTPFKLELYTKTNVFIAKLCVYFEKTPVLDQVLGVIMYIRGNSEDIILEKANFYSRNTDLEICEILCQKYPQISKKLRR